MVPIPLVLNVSKNLILSVKVDVEQYTNNKNYIYV
jgi:hypothetical protein